MGRLERLQKEITKGLNSNVSTLKGDVIDRWSPNNLRRLCISPKVMIVEYYVCDGKTKRLREIIPVEEDFANEFNRLHNDEEYRKTGYNGLLTCLTKTRVGKSPRIFSSVEEIVFFGGYPAELFKLDTDLNSLAYGTKKGVDGVEMQNAIKNRFKRLKSISLIQVTEDEMLECLNECRGFGMDLLTTLVDKNGVTPARNFVINTKDWWSATYLRGAEYSMDAEDSKLSNYFRENVAKMDESLKRQEMERKYSELQNKTADSKENEQEIKMFYKSINSTCTDIVEILNLCKDIYDYTVKLDKVQWASYLKDVNLNKLVKQDVLKRQLVKKQLEKFNIAELRQCLIDYDLDSRNINKVLTVLGVDLNLLPKNTNGIPFDKSAIDKVFKWYLGALTNITYFVFVKHLVKTGTKEFAVRFHLNKLNIPSIYYTDKVVEYVNVNLASRDAVKVLDLVDNSRKISENDFNRVVKATETKKILNALKEYTKL